MIDSFAAEQLARRYRIDEFTILREYLQLLFLKYLYQLPSANKVYFKGGTALHFIYNSFRFSEDLDFTSVLSRNLTRTLIENSFENFVQEATRVELKEQESIRGLTFRIKHRPENIPHFLTIRLDLSFRERPLQEETSVIESDFPVFPYPLVTHLGPEELLAEKIRALLVRDQPRDLFDIWFLLSQKVKLRPEFIEKKLEIYPHFKLKDLRSQILERLKSFSPEELAQDLNKFLPENYRYFYKQLPTQLTKKIKSQEF